MKRRPVSRRHQIIRKSGQQNERGGALLELALVLPLIMAFVTGVVTGGIGLSRDISLNNAAREGARFGATLPYTDLSAFLNTVADVSVNAATGELDDGEPAREVCVAYVYPDGTDPVDRTTRLVVDAAGGRTITVGAVCYPDSRPNGERRVQVNAARTTELQAAFWSSTITIEGSSTVRYERAGQ